MDTVRFGPFHYNTSTGVLHKNGSETVLRQKVHLLLKTFVNQEGELLSRQSLMAAVWPGEHVEANTFFQCMNQLRKALEEDPQEPHFLQNFPRKGYVWLCPVEKMPPAKPMAKRYWRPIGFAAMLLAACIFFFWFKKTERTPLSQSQALFSQSENATLLTEGLTAQANLPAVLVTDPNHPAEPDDIDQKHTMIGKRIANMEGSYPQQFSAAKLAFKRGDPLTCERILSKLLSRANAEQYTQAQAMAALSLANITRFRNPKVAKTQLRQAKQLYLELRDHQKFRNASFLLVLVHLDLGDFAKANEILHSDLLPRGRRKRQRMSHYALAKGLLHLKTGELLEAETALLHGRQRLNTKRTNKITLQFDLLEGAILLAQGNFEQAGHMCRQLVSQASDLGQPFLALQARWLLAQVEAGRNQPNQAAAHYRFVHDQAKRFEMDFFLAKATWTLKHSQPKASNATILGEDISQDHRLLIERLVTTNTTGHVSESAQLFNL